MIIAAVAALTSVVWGPLVLLTAPVWVPLAAVVGAALPVVGN